MRSLAILVCFILASPVWSLTETPRPETLENSPCEVAYSPFRWLAALCMWRNKADNSRADLVQTCVDDEWKAAPKFKSVCEANWFWKTQWCTMHFHLGYEANVTGCVADANKLYLNNDFGFD